MEKIEYNPEIHCCKNWYKDFCDCIVEGRKKHRDENVNNTLNFLKKYNIPFTESKIMNVVIINPETDNVFLSLKREKNLFKCKFTGKNIWFTYSEKKFIDKFSNKK